MAPFQMAHYDATKDHILFDPTPCFTNIVKALTKVRTEVIEIYEDLEVDLPTKRWTGFVSRQERELLLRRARDGLSLKYTGVELMALMREIQVFGVSAQRSKHAITNMLTMSPTHGLCMASGADGL